jgi:hypothetical protein
MKFLTLTAVIVVLFTFQLFSYSNEDPMLNLECPTKIEEGDLDLIIRHSYLAPIGNDSSTFFGMEGGANAHIGVRVIPWKALEISSSYTSLWKELAVGADYSLEFKNAGLKWNFGADYFNYSSENADNRRGNFFIRTALQTVQIKKHLSFSLNGTFDFYNMQPGVGVGTTLSFTDKMHLQMEYIPVFKLDKDNSNINPKHTYSVGFRIDTWGHHFTFFVSNSQEAGIRRAALAAVQ